MFSSNLPAPPKDPVATEVSSGDTVDTAPVKMPVPRYTSPTWELEIFISGGIIFSLLQLPPLVNDVVNRWEPHATDGIRQALIMVSLYLKSALYSLIVAFIIHLGARAYWGGLMGLYSVFPNGIRWDRTHIGPIGKEVYQQRLPALPRLIDATDNFASIIFSFAFLVVFVCVLSLAGILVALGAYAVAKGTIGVAAFRIIGSTLLLLIFLVPVAVAIYDLKRGPKLDPKGRTASRLRRLMNALYRVQLTGVSAPILLTISSNSRTKTTFAVFYLAVVGSLTIALSELAVRGGLFSLTGTEFFSTRSDEHSVDFASYESQWTKDYVNSAAPSIQSDVIREPYLRLFIPYQLRRHDPALQKQCANVQPLQKRGLRPVASLRTGAAADSASDRILRCLAEMHAVKVNGTPQPDLRFRFATHPQTGINGIITYLPVSELPRGENVVTVMPPPRSPRSKNKRPLQLYVIPFWL